MILADRQADNALELVGSTIIGTFCSASVMDARYWGLQIEAPDDRILDLFIRSSVKSYEPGTMEIVLVPEKSPQ